MDHKRTYMSHVLEIVDLRWLSVGPTKPNNTSSRLFAYRTKICKVIIIFSCVCLIFSKGKICRKELLLIWKIQETKTVR